MKAHENRIKTMKTVYGEDDEDQTKKLAIEPAEVEQIKESKYPTPLDFIKLVQNDQEFHNRFCYCHKNSDYYDF